MGCGRPASARSSPNRQCLRQDVDLEKFVEKYASPGIRILIWEDGQFPCRLKKIDQPPPVL